MRETCGLSARAQLDAPAVGVTIPLWALGSLGLTDVPSITVRQNNLCTLLLVVGAMKSPPKRHVPVTRRRWGPTAKGMALFTAGQRRRLSLGSFIRPATGRILSRLQELTMDLLVSI